MKPKVRSKTRLRLGRLYFQYKRYVEWYFGNTKFAKQVLVQENHALMMYQPFLTAKMEDPLKC